MHAALEAHNPARQAGRPRTPSATTAAWRRGRGQAALWIIALLVIVCVSQADGLLASIVPYERDTTVFYFPLMSWVAQQLHQGHLPLWTPQIFGGYPLFGDGEIGLAYPPVLLALFALPTDRAFVVLRVLHLSIAALGAFALARGWKLPYPSAALAGVVFSLGSFLPAQIHHENVVRTASWLPVILAAVECGLRAESWRARLRWTLLAAGALGLAGLSLHSQMLAIDLLILGAYGGLRWGVGPLTPATSRRVWAGRLIAVVTVCGPVVLLGLGLAAVQLLPLIELAGFSSRGSGIPYADSAAYSLTFFGLAQAIFPYVFRGLGNHQWGLWTHWESYLYIGLAPLVLAILALLCMRRREVAAWAAMGWLGLILALGQYSPLNLHYLVWLLPGLSGLRAPGRFTVLVVLAGGMLAAYGLAWLQTLAAARPGRAPERRRLRHVLRGLGAATLCVLLVVGGLHAALQTWPAEAAGVIQAVYLSQPRDTYALSALDVFNGVLWSTDLANPHVWSALISLTLILAIVWVWQQGRGWRGWPAVLVGLAAADLLMFAWQIHPREPLSILAAEPAALQALDRLPAVDGAPNRVISSPVLNQVAADRLAPFAVAEADGYSSLQFIWHRAYVTRVESVDDRLLDLWNVRYILEPAHYGQLWSYKGVSFLPGQTLLHAPGGGALAEQRFGLSGDAPITELKLVTAMMDAVAIPQGTPVATLELRDASEQVVGTAEMLAGRDTMEWAYALPNVRPYVQHQQVESAAEPTEGGADPSPRQLSFADFVLAWPVAATSLTVRAVLPSGELALYGGAIVSSDGAAEQLFGRTQTKYRPLFTDAEITVLEDTAALPRAFIVPHASVAPSGQSGLDEMIHKPFEPEQHVVLAEDASTRGSGFAADRGGRGEARVTAYSADDVKIHSSATADAWLVLSDTYYPGWVALVDGQPAPVLRGDVLFRVVPVPGGEHEVEFRFEPASVRAGLALSLATLLLMVGAWVVAGRRTRADRTTTE